MSLQRLARIVLGFSLAISTSALASDIIIQNPSEVPQAMQIEAMKLLASLTSTQKDKATYSFDAKERKEWRYFPSPSKMGSLLMPEHSGLSIAEFTPAQKQILNRMLDLALTGEGVDATWAAVEADKDTSLKTRGVVNKILFKYGPENYFFSFFGSPTEPTWAWRFEGHHISINITNHPDGRVTSGPTFIGTNPNSVKMPDGRDVKVLKPLMDTARKLVQSLDKYQMSTATKAVSKVPKFMYYGPGLLGGELKFKKPEPGLSFSKMSPEQKQLLLSLIAIYQNHFDFSLRTNTLQMIEARGIENLEFVWTGDTKMEKPFYFRVQGPSFILEISCSEGQADHYHSAWIDL